MSKKKRQVTAETETVLSEDHTLLFITTHEDTWAVCETLRYSKRVAWHKDKKADVQNLHDDSKRLFSMYVDDAMLKVKKTC